MCSIRQGFWHGVTPISTHPHLQDASDDESQQGQCRTPSPPRSRAPATTPASTGKLLPLEFMERKAAMKKTVAQVLAGGEGSRSIRGKMSVLLAKIEQEKLATLEEGPNNTIKALEAADKALQVQLEALEGI